MYRASEVRLFKVLNILGDLFALFAFVAILCHFFLPLTFLPGSYLALIGIVFSAFFKLQIFIYKLVIIEKRLLHLVEPSLQHFEVASRWSMVHLVIYFVIFWVVLIGVSVSLIPIV